MYIQPAKNSYFTNLDAFRFLSFLGVFISHTLVFPKPANVVGEFFITLITLNYLAVPFFFTLSSFLITYRLLSEKENKGSIALFKFYQNRALRIWPAYFLLIIICFLGLPLISNAFNIHSPSLPDLLPFLLFYVNFYIIENGMAFTFALSILWSISIEEQFYLVWGLAIKCITQKWIVPVILLLFIFSIAFSYSYLYIQHKAANNLAIHSIFILQDFCTGALIALICVNKQKTFHWLNAIPVSFLSAVYLVLPLSFFLIKDMLLLNVIKSICYSLIIFDQSFNERRIFNAGKIAILNYLGKISYGLYLYHALVIVLLEKVFGFFSFFNNPVMSKIFVEALITLIVTIIIAHGSYKYLESRFLALKRL